MSEPSSQKWHYADSNNQAVGPFAKEDLLKLRSAGIINDQTLVFEEGGSEWKSIESIWPSPKRIPALPTPVLPTPAPAVSGNNILNGCLIGFAVIVVTSVISISTQGDKKDSGQTHTNVATPLKSIEELPIPPKSHADNIIKLMSAYSVKEGAMGAPRLERGKYYLLGNLGTTEIVVQQVENDNVLLKHVTRYDRSSRVDEKLIGIVTFQNPKALDGVQITKGDSIQAVGRFIEFKNIEMTNGAVERLPMFNCVGINVPGLFVNTE